MTTHKLNGLPASEEGEKGVLASLLLSPGPVFSLLAKLNWSPDLFYHPAHRQIFSAVASLMAEGKPVDFITLATRLRDVGALENCGGAAYITELMVYLPTSISAGHYAEAVMGAAARRRLILTGERIAELARLPDANPLELADELRAAADATAKISAPPSEPLLQKLDSARFAWSAEVPRPEPIYMLGDHTIATAGNLLGVAAQAKAGKSAFIGAMMAAAIGPGDTLGLRSANHAGRALLHFDCEQSRYHHDAMVRRALRRARCTAPPEWLESYWLTGWKLKDRRDSVLIALEAAKKRRGGIHSIIIDGLADLCVDPNDTAESFGLIDELHQAGIAFDTLFTLVIHENPGTEIGKTRGHLGSQLERKAETNIRLQKDAEGVTVVFTERSREAHIPKSKGPCFAWSDEEGMHVSCASQGDDRTAAKREKLKEIRDQVFDETGGLGLSWEQLHKAIEAKEGCSRATARRRFDSMVESGLLRKSHDQYWPQK